MKQTDSYQYQISVAAGENYPALLAIWEAAVRSTHDFLSEEDIAYFRPLILNEYFDQLQLYCVKMDEEISGFIGVNHQNIEMLFIAPEYMGKGIGKVLLQYAIEKHNCNKVDVNEQNPKALVFYIKNGFCIQGRSDIDGSGKPYPLLHLVNTNYTVLNNRSNQAG